MHQAQVQRVVAALNVGAGSGQKRRDFIRWPFVHASVRMKMHNGDGLQSEFSVACRDLSKGGISVLHRSFLHTGTRVVMRLPTVTGKLATIPGVVCRCRHFQGLIHEIGIKFNEPIDVNEFVELDPLADCFSLERVDPETLRGCVVHVEDSELDQRIARHHLRQTQLRLRTAPTVAEGLAVITEGCDLVLCDYDLPDGTGADLLAGLAERGIKLPSIITTSDIAALTRRGLRQVNANAFLAKPIKPDMLMRAIAEFLAMNRSAGPLSCTLSPEDPAMPLAEAFVQEMRRLAGDLDRAIGEADAVKARRICLRIAGTAPSVGFQGIADLAGTAAKDLAGSASTAESMAPIRALMSACERAKTPGSQNHDRNGRGAA